MLVTDLHLGKSDHFRASGIPVPDGADGDTLGRLSALLTAVEAKRLVILGDLFQTAAGVTGPVLDRLAAFRAAWPELRSRRPRQPRPQRGRPAGLARDHLPRRTCRRRRRRLRHEPAAGLDEPFAPGESGQADGTTPTFCGHLHPAVSMKTGRDRMRMPCFLFRGSTALLPAFGASPAATRSARVRATGSTPSAPAAWPT